MNNTSSHNTTADIQFLCLEGFSIVLSSIIHFRENRHVLVTDFSMGLEWSVSRLWMLKFDVWLQTAAAAKPTQYTGTYQANATGYQTTYAQPAVQTTIAAQPTTQAKREYSHFPDSSLFSRIHVVFIC